MSDNQDIDNLLDQIAALTAEDDQQHRRLDSYRLKAYCLLTGRWSQYRMMKRDLKWRRKMAEQSRKSMVVVKEIRDQRDKKDQSP